jgi:hypothetical protein
VAIDDVYNVPRHATHGACKHTHNQSLLQAIVTAKQGRHVAAKHVCMALSSRALRQALKAPHSVRALQLSCKC